MDTSSTLCLANIGLYQLIEMLERPITNLSLFSGAGGLDIGLERAGFQTRICVENDKYCQGTLGNNRDRFSDPGLEVLGDITKIVPSDLLELSGLKQGEVDLVSGGPPCQAFSEAPSFPRTMHAS